MHFDFVQGPVLFRIFNLFFFSSMYILECEFLNLKVVILSARVVCVSVLLWCRLIDSTSCCMLWLQIYMCISSSSLHPFSQDESSLIALFTVWLYLLTTMRKMRIMLTELYGILWICDRMSLAQLWMCVLAWCRVQIYSLGIRQFVGFVSKT